MELSWQGRRWNVRRTGEGGPGPNRWDERNVRLDARGDLRLEIVKRDGLWTCAELQTRERLGFGTYAFDLVGRPDRFIPQVVLGMFNYPTPEIGTDGTNEIDIELARWGDAKNPVGNFTVWPAEKGIAQISQTFPVALTGEFTRHTFVWTPTEILFTSRHGHADTGPVISSWRFAPNNPRQAIPQKPLPLHLNLWLFQGKAPADNRPVSVGFRKLTFTAR